MNVPDHVLSNLSHWIQNFDSKPEGPEVFKTNGFQIDSKEWSCLLCDQDQVTWYFRPFAPRNGEDKCNSQDSKSKPYNWEVDETRTAELQKSLRSLCTSLSIEDPSSRFWVVQSDFCDAVLGRCGDLHLVADLLQSWGIPSKTIVLDWLNQRESLSPNAIFSTAETLVTEDGLLLPLDAIVRQLENAPDFIKGKTEKLAFVSLRTRFQPPPDWPSVSITPTIELKSVAIPKLDLSGPRQAKRTQTKRSNWFPIGIAVGIFTTVLVTVWQSTGNDENRNLKPHSTANSTLAMRDQSIRVPAPAESSIASGANESSESSEPLDLPLESNTAVIDSGIIDSGELSIDTLLLQLQTKEKLSPGLSTVSAASIIQGAIKETKAVASEGTKNRISVDDSEPEPELNYEVTELKTIQSDEGGVSLERPLQIKTALAKELVSFGRPVIAKACYCEIELKQPDKLIVEPGEVVTIEGQGKQSWRFALEDEEPELRMEIASKPGSRWQIITSVGLIERIGAQPILIGPRDAQNVGNRLIQYRQWTEQAIETLRMARANRQGKSLIDFAGEIKKLEVEQREANKAIDRWKVIARLCHLLFDQLEIRIQFNAVEKPSSKP